MYLGLRRIDSLDVGQALALSRSGIGSGVGVATSAIPGRRLPDLQIRAVELRTFRRLAVASVGGGVRPRGFAPSFPCPPPPTRFVGETQSQAVAVFLDFSLTLSRLWGILLYYLVPRIVSAERIAPSISIARPLTCGKNATEFPVRTVDDSNPLPEPHRNQSRRRR